MARAGIDLEARRPNPWRRHRHGRWDLPGHVVVEPEPPEPDAPPMIRFGAGQQVALSPDVVLRVPFGPIVEQAGPPGHFTYDAAERSLVVALGEEQADYEIRVSCAAQQINPGQYRFAFAMLGTFSNALRITPWTAIGTPATLLIDGSLWRDMPYNVIAEIHPVEIGSCVINATSVQLTAHA